MSIINESRKIQSLSFIVLIAIVSLFEPNLIQQPKNLSLVQFKGFGSSNLIICNCMAASSSNSYQQDEEKEMFSRSLSFLVWSPVSNILELSEDQKDGINQVFDIGDQVFTDRARQLARPLTSSEYNRIRDQLYLEHIYPHLTPHQIGLYQFILFLCPAEPPLLKLVRDPKIAEELKVNSDLKKKIDELFEGWARMFIKNVMADQSLVGPIQLFELRDRFGVAIRNNTTPINKTIRLKLESLFLNNQEQKQRLNELDNQNQLVNGGVLIFLDERIKSELMLEDSQLEKLKRMYTITKGEKWDRQLELYHLKQDYLDFLNEMSFSQRQAWKLMLGKPSEAIKEWDRQNLLDALEDIPEDKRE